MNFDLMNFALSLYQWRGVWGERQTDTLLTRKGYVANLGHQEDESGFVYMRARYYEPTTGRFISEDPARDGINWYLYADGNPVLYVDYYGTFHLISMPFTMRDSVRLQGAQARQSFSALNRIREFAEDLQDITDMVVSFYLQDIGAVTNIGMHSQAMSEFRDLVDSGSRDIKKWRKFKGMFHLNDGSDVFFTAIGLKGKRHAYLFKWKP